MKDPHYSPSISCRHFIKRSSATGALTGLTVMSGLRAQSPNNQAEHRCDWHRGARQLTEAAPNTKSPPRWATRAIHPKARAKPLNGSVRGSLARCAKCIAGLIARFVARALTVSCIGHKESPPVPPTNRRFRTPWIGIFGKALRHINPLSPPCIPPNPGFRDLSRQK